MTGSSGSGRPRRSFNTAVRRTKLNPLVCDDSQGAAMAALMSALVSHPKFNPDNRFVYLFPYLEKPEVFPPFLVDGKPPHPPL